MSEAENCEGDGASCFGSVQRLRHDITAVEGFEFIGRFPRNWTWLSRRHAALAARQSESAVGPAGAAGEEGPRLWMGSGLCYFITGVRFPDGTAWKCLDDLHGSKKHKKTRGRIGLVHGQAPKRYSKLYWSYLEARLAQESDRWRQFCIQYAKSVAFKFAESWQQYTVNAGIALGSIATSDVVEQFSNTLSEELTERLATPNIIRPTTTFLQANASSLQTPSGNVNYRERSCGWRSLNEYGRPASIADIAWMSRSRSEVASRGSSMLADSMIQQHQPAPSNPPRSSTKRLSWFRSHFPAKTAVELIREGNVRYMSGCELETKQWRKCKLCLVKTAGGYLLEFYSPPKSNRAKSGIFCFLIMEVRETTPLEFEEGNESIFAIRGYNDAEYVIEARNPEDCQQWLAVIRGCISVNDPNTSQRFIRQPSAPPTGSCFLRSRQFFSTRSLNNVHAMTSSGIETRIPVTMHAFPPGLEIYPWFHARLSRSVSARLVLHSGVDGHGLFLVRQSETRPGEFVLTFNCQGKAKHVRIAVMPDGECRIHQMIFETMIDLLEYFRDNPIPLESSSTPPMLLNEYVICWRRRSLTSLDLDVRDFLTYAGSVRLDIRALEELVRHEQHDRQHRATTANNSYRYQ